MEIVNIVASGTLGQKIDLMKLYNTIDEFQYDPEGYHGGYLKLSKYTVTVYRTGKYIIPGIKQINDIEPAFEEINNLLEYELDPILFEKPTIKNIVAMTKISKSINLKDLIFGLLNENQDAEYEPEVFPGLIWRTGKGTANIYGNGKIVLLGTKSEEELLDLENRVIEKLS
jgi:transcription initiation factor TFIID TATA-box-binding protein